jgi:DNA-dependent RNA polymerase auxiliary subunit epsilon
MKPFGGGRHLQTVEGTRRLMLRAAKVVLIDGTEYEDVELIPSDDGIVVVQSAVGESEVVIHIMHHAISRIFYQDAGSRHFARGRALAMYYDDAEKVREILEDFDFELNEMAEFIAESLEPMKETTQEQVKGANPYD